MGLAFEVTRNDVWQVIWANGGDLYSADFDAAFEALDRDRVERAALTEDDLEDQTFAAYIEIAEQLRDLGYLAPA